jgi:hypothetical protein
MKKVFFRANHFSLLSCLQLSSILNFVQILLYLVHVVVVICTETRKIFQKFTSINRGEQQIFLQNFRQTSPNYLTSGHLRKDPNKEFK